MVRILIAGKNSYIGNALEKWLKKNPDKYVVDKITLKDNDWQNKDLSQYKVIICLAAIVHRYKKRCNADTYNTVNCELIYKLACKAKTENVSQFIFMSTMGVYGEDGAVYKACEIDEGSCCKPNSAYEVSKFAAENALLSLQSVHFHLAIIRAPFIYGPGCPGNYLRVRRFALRFPVFPHYKNSRSMLFIENCSEFIRLLIDSMGHGIFFPQDRELMCTADMVKQIARQHGKQIYLCNGLQWIIYLFGWLPIIKKVFGNLTYKKSLSDHFNGQYQVISTNKAIEITERYWDNYFIID